MYREERLKEEINDLGKSNNIFAVINLLQDKKDELETLRENKMKRQIVRSRVQWLRHGEKLSKYFALWKINSLQKKLLNALKKKMAQLSMNKQRF